MARFCFCLLAAMASQLFCIADVANLPARHRSALQDVSRFREIHAVTNLPAAVVALCSDDKGRLAERKQKWESAATAACGSRSCLNVTRVIPGSTHNWTIVTRSPGPNQPAICLRDKCNPLWWFRNVDEPTAPDWYRPGKADRNFRYHLRNPCHNFFCYVIGISDKRFRRAGKYPNDNFSPHGGWNMAASNYKYLCLWLPFISYEHRGFQFYIGWRNGGNFGVKLRYSKPKS